MHFSKILATFAGTLLLSYSAKVNGVTQYGLPSYRISAQSDGLKIVFQPFHTSESVLHTSQSILTQFHVKSGSSDEHYVGTTETNKQTLNVLIRNGEIVVGSIVDEEDGNVYNLSRNEKGDLLVTQTHTSEFPFEFDPVEDESPIHHLREKDSTSFQEKTHHHCPKHIIDVLVPWTEEAECENSKLKIGCTRTKVTAQNMKDLIKLVVAETNTAYQNSGVTVNGQVARLNLVHAYYEPSIDESIDEGNGLSGILNYIQGSKQIAAKRTQYGADIVASIVSRVEGGCGSAKSGPKIDRMFSVTKFYCAVGNFSFGHEIAHNLGAHHDRGSSKKCNSSGYDYAFRDPSGDFRSIVAYKCKTGQCDNISKIGCPRVQMFSSKEILYNGKHIGSAEADNARQLREQFATVSRYYPCKYATNAPTYVKTTNAPTYEPTSTNAPTYEPTSTNAPTHYDAKTEKQNLMFLNYPEKVDRK